MPATTQPTLSDPQLRLIRSVLTQGWPADLLPYCVSRSGATDGDWVVLAEGGLVELVNNRWHVTKAGKRLYTRLKVGRWF